MPKKKTDAEKFEERAQTKGRIRVELVHGEDNVHVVQEAQPAEVILPPPIVDDVNKKGKG